MPRVSSKRRAHFPVGGKRNTLNFFGHGNRPKKRKGKTAAEEEDDDERPTRRSRHSDNWIMLAAVGGLGAAGVYWAFTHPQETKAAAKALGVADLPVIREALNVLTTESYEDRLKRDKILSDRLQAEHGGHQGPTVDNPTTRTGPRPLNAQESKIVQGLKAAGHVPEAKFFEETMQAKTEIGDLSVPPGSWDPADPLASTGAFLAARQRLDLTTINSVEEAVTKAFPNFGKKGAPQPSPKEIEQVRGQATELARHEYNKWASTSVRRGGAQALGEQEVQDLKATEQVATLRDPTQSRYGGPTETAARAALAQQDVQDTSSPASSWRAAIPMLSDRSAQVLIGGTPSMVMAMTLQGWAADANERGTLGNLPVHHSPKAVELAEQAKRNLEISQARQAAEKAGNRALVRHLDDQKLSGIQTEDTNQTGAEVSDITGKTTGTLASSMMLRTIARNMSSRAVGGFTAAANTIGNLINTPKDKDYFKNVWEKEKGVPAAVASQVAVNEAVRRSLQTSNALAKIAPGTPNFPGRVGYLEGLQAEVASRPGAVAIPKVTTPTALSSQLTAEPAELARIRAVTQRALQAVPGKGGSTLSQIAAKTRLHVSSVARQADWLLSTSTTAEVKAALPALTESKLASPLLLSALKKNWVRGGIAGLSSAATLSTVMTGFQALGDLTVLGAHGLQGNAREYNDTQQRERALRYTLGCGGRVADATGLSGNPVVSLARMGGHAIGNTLLTDLESVYEREAAVFGYASDDPNDPRAQGVRIGIYNELERTTLAKTIPLANQFMDSDPRWAHAPLDQRAKAADMIAAGMTSRFLKSHRGAPVLTQEVLDQVPAAIDSAARHYKFNPLAVADSSGHQLIAEHRKFMNNLLPPADFADDYRFLDAGAKNNAAIQQGLDPDALIAAGKDGETVLNESTSRFAERNLERLQGAPGAVGTGARVNDQVYGNIRRNIARAFGAPGLRDMAQQDQDIVMASALQRAEKVFAPIVEAHIKANPNDYDLKEFTKPEGTFEAVRKQYGWGPPEQRTSLAGGGSAEDGLNNGLRIIQQLADPEVAKVMTPDFVKGEAARVTGMDWDQRNNQPDVGLFTENSTQGRALRARDEAWAKDIEATTGIKMDQGAYNRIVAKARSQGVQLPTRYENQGDAEDSAGAQNRRGRVDVEIGPNGELQYVVKGEATKGMDPTAKPGQIAAVLRRLAERNPDVFQQFAKDSLKTPITSVLLAQERPDIEQALKAAGGGYTKLGPNGEPVGTVGTWDELRADIQANAQNYNDVWRPEVKTYIGDWKRYHGLKTQAPMEPTPEVAADLQGDGAYQKFISKELDAWRKANPDATGGQFSMYVPGASIGGPENWAPPPVPQAAFKPSMTRDEFKAGLRWHPEKSKEYLQKPTQDWLEQKQTHEANMATLRAPPFPRQTKPYAGPPATPAVTPKPVAPVQPVTPPTPAVTPPAPTGRLTAP